MKFLRTTTCRFVAFRLFRCVFFVEEILKILSTCFSRVPLPIFIGIYLLVFYILTLKSPSLIYGKFLLLSYVLSVKEILKILSTCFLRVPLPIFVGIGLLLFYILTLGSPSLISGKFMLLLSLRKPLSLLKHALSS